MNIFKFGGASVNNIERIQQLYSIVKSQQNGPLVIIVSAMGKTTNELESVVSAFYNDNLPKAIELFEKIKVKHLQVANELLSSELQKCVSQLNDFFTEVEWLIHDKPVRDFSYYYDQIVSIGELLSTSIIGHYLNEKSLSVIWLDVRDLLRTDDQFRNANIDWQETQKRLINSEIGKSNASNQIFITQGFIGCTDANENTTLGREGSDYTAAIFANLLNADSVTIWKDVAGIMNADPKEFEDAIVMPVLDYTEVIEMAFYGAQVIHPKTIKPLQNKGISLKVKCFLDPALDGTIISQKSATNLPPIYVVKQNQVLLHLSTTDFSFVGEAHMSLLYKILATLSISPNLVQTGAVNVQLCLDNQVEKIEKIALELSKLYEVQVESNLTLVTIRHYNKESLNNRFSNRSIVLKQQSRETVQMLYAN